MHSHVCWFCHVFAQNSSGKKSVKNIPVENKSVQFMILKEFYWNSSGIFFTINNSTSFQWNLIFSSGIWVEFLCPLESSGIPLGIIFYGEGSWVRTWVFATCLWLDLLYNWPQNCEWLCTSHLYPCPPSMGLARELLFDCPRSIRILPGVNNGTAP